MTKTYTTKFTIDIPVDATTVIEESIIKVSETTKRCKKCNTPLLAKGIRIIRECPYCHTYN
jgi:Zn finger protein HypA/HybF involved in hydrogenase expression